LIGYLWARLYLPYAFAKAQSAAQVDTAWTYADWADQAFDSGEIDKADQWVDIAIQNDPTNAKARLLKGMILKKLAIKPDKQVDKGLLQQALAESTKAAELMPNFAAAFYNMACYQALLGEARTEVLKNLSRAFELNSKLKPNAPTDDDLASIWDDADFKRLTA
jgi:tetratricopeptide (TPR) repeat protein